MSNKIDHLLSQLGTGWWHFLHYVTLGYCMGLPVAHALGGPFLAPVVDHTCIPPDIERSTTSFRKDIWSDFESEDLVSNQVYLNSSQKNQCTFLVEDSETEDFKDHLCTEWHFDNSTFTTTITSEFKLVCNRNYLRATYQSIYMLGVFVGSLLSAFLADKYGRKRMTLVGLIPFGVLGLATSWVTNLSALLFCRFVMGIIMPFISNTCFIMVVEVSEPRLRPLLGILAGLPWAFGVMIWGGTAYFIRNWRWLQLTISISAVLIIPFLWFMDESPRWLAVTGHHDRALQVFKKAARWNRASLPPDDEVLKVLKESQNIKTSTKNRLGNQELRAVIKDKIASTIILFRTPKLRKITIILYITFTIMNMAYYGLSLSGSNLSDDPFVFMILSGLMEVSAYSLPVPIVSRFGRKIPGIVSFFLSGVALLAIAPIPKGYEWLIMALAMVGKLALSAAYQIIVFYASELFPTEVRSRGIGTCEMVARVGSIASPFITDLLGSAFSWAPSVVFGVTSIIAGVITLALPETLNVDLPDTIAQLEERTDQAQTRSWVAVPTSENVFTTKEENFS